VLCCRCGPSCTNTPAARKASAAPLRLVALPGKGVGAVAKAAIPAGAFVAEYLGEVVPLQVSRGGFVCGGEGGGGGGGGGGRGGGQLQLALIGRSHVYQL
jgi:hypothetical protein